MRISDWSSDVCSSDLTAVEIGQRVAVIQPFGLGHDAFDEMEHAPGAVDEAFQQFLRIDTGLRAPLIEPGLGARGCFRRRHPKQGASIEDIESTEERLIGKVSAIRCRSRWTRYA